MPAKPGVWVTGFDKSSRSGLPQDELVIGLPAEPVSSRAPVEGKLVRERRPRQRLDVDCAADLLQRPYMNHLLEGHYYAVEGHSKQAATGIPGRRIWNPLLACLTERDPLLRHVRVHRLRTRRRLSRPPLVRHRPLTLQVDGNDSHENRSAG